jgi:hypothetical protein
MSWNQHSNTTMALADMAWHGIRACMQHKEASRALPLGRPRRVASVVTSRRTNTTGMLADHGPRGALLSRGDVSPGVSLSRCRRRLAASAGDVGARCRQAMSSGAVSPGEANQAVGGPGEVMG